MLPQKVNVSTISQILTPVKLIQYPSHFMFTLEKQQGPHEVLPQTLTFSLHTALELLAVDLLLRKIIFEFFDELRVVDTRLHFEVMVFSKLTSISEIMFNVPLITTSIIISPLFPFVYPLLYFALDCCASPRSGAS